MAPRGPGRLFPPGSRARHCPHPETGLRSQGARRRPPARARRCPRSLQPPRGPSRMTPLPKA
eukprot:837411-Alexandrium_andersonii.AAC.1